MKKFREFCALVTHICANSEAFARSRFRSKATEIDFEALKIDRERKPKSHQILRLGFHII